MSKGAGIILEQISGSAGSPENALEKIDNLVALHLSASEDHPSSDNIAVTLSVLPYLFKQNLAAFL